MTRLFLLMLLLVALITIGCRPGHSIATYSYNFPPSETNKTLSEKQMHDAIVKACVNNGWRVSMISPGSIEATLMVRNKHTVIVNIPYTPTNYSINYKASTNMEYKVKKDGSTIIHPNYNKWVARLDQSIRNNVAAGEY